MRAARRVTVTFTGPVPAGAVAVIWVAPFTVKVARLWPPKSTAVAPVRSVPVMTTVVPPRSILGWGRGP